MSFSKIVKLFFNLESVMFLCSSAYLIGLDIPVLQIQICKSYDTYILSYTNHLYKKTFLRKWITFELSFM